MPPVTLSRTRKMPDLLGTGRMSLLFGAIPGAADDGAGSVGGEGLSIKKAEVTIPAVNLGQIRVPLLGFPVAFRGNFIDHQNRFTANFYEDSFGGTQVTLFKWMNFVRNFDDSNGAYKDQYAINARLDVWNTLGRAAYSLNLEAVWPISVTPPASSEDSQVAHVNCEFSVDFISLLGAEDSPRTSIRNVQR